MGPLTICRIVFLLFSSKLAIWASVMANTCLINCRVTSAG